MTDINEKEVSKTLNKDENQIEIELKLKNKALRIHGAGKGVWAVCTTALGVSAITSAAMIGAYGSIAFVVNQLRKGK